MCFFFLDRCVWSCHVAVRLVASRHIMACCYTTSRHSCLKFLGSLVCGTELVVVWSHETPHQQILTQDFFDARMISRTRSRLLSCDTRVWYLSLVWVCSASGSRTHRIPPGHSSWELPGLIRLWNLFLACSASHVNTGVDSLRIGYEPHSVLFSLRETQPFGPGFRPFFGHFFGGLKRGRKMVIFWCFFLSIVTPHVITGPSLLVIKLFLSINTIALYH